MSLSQALQLGVAKIDITPPEAVPLAGFACRQGVCQGVRRRLYARIFYFSQAAEKTRKAVLISADLIWWETSFVRKLRECLAQVLSLEPQEILFHGTHNHSGPQTGEDLTPSLGVSDPAYLAFLEKKVLEGIMMAKAQTVPVSLSYYQDQCHLAVNRRKLSDGKVLMQPSFSGPVDHAVGVVCFKDERQQTVGMLVHYTCHATTTADNWVSSEFPGVAMEKLEDEYACVVGYLQGCCADVRPALVEGEEFFRGGDEEVVSLGNQLYKAVQRALQHTGKLLTPGLLGSRLVSLSLPLSALPKQQEIQQAMDEPGVRGEWATMMQRYSELSKTASLEIIRLDLAKDLILLGLSGEIAVQYGLAFKQQIEKHLLPMGYTNGMTGYIPTAKQLQEGGYEAHDAAWYFALPSPFAPAIEALLLSTVKTIMEEDELDE